MFSGLIRSFAVALSAHHGSSLHFSTLGNLYDSREVSSGGWVLCPGLVSYTLASGVILDLTGLSVTPYAPLTATSIAKFPDYLWITVAVSCIEVTLEVFRTLRMTIAIDASSIISPSQILQVGTPVTSPGFVLVLNGHFPSPIAEAVRVAVTLTRHLVTGHVRLSESVRVVI